jgi:hypothetical protein
MKAVWIALVASVACRAEVFTVCDLLAKMPAHDGETIQVKGVFAAGAEAALIVDRSCAAPISNHDQKWSSAIWLASSNAFDKLDEVERQARGSSSNVIATFTGKLKYCPVLAKTRSGEPRWVGCGHLGAFPLELTVTTVSDIRIEKRQ